MVFRQQPKMPVSSYKTYQIAMPEPSHTRAASCVEVDCDVQQTGWVSIIDEATPLGQKQAHYIRRLSGRHFDEGARDVLTLFTFPPGQECFDEHRVSVDREAFYVVRGGDWRGNPTGVRRFHDSGDHWVEDFAGHQERLATAQN